MIVTYKYFCQECGGEVEISDEKCSDSSCSSSYLKTTWKKYYKVSYDSFLFFFNVKSELVQLPSVEFTSMHRKESWLVNAKTELRLKHFNELLPSKSNLSRKSKIKTFLSNIFVGALEILTRKTTQK